MQRFQLHEIAVQALRTAMRLGASEAEVFITRERGYAATASSSRVEGLNTIDEAGMGVRVAVGKRTGFAYTSSLEWPSIRQTVEYALKLARTSREDPYWPGLPYPSDSYPEPRSLYSSSIASAAAEDIVEDLGVLLSTVSEEGGQLVFGEVYAGVIERVVANTNGVYRVDVGTIAAVFVEASIRTSAGPTPGVYELESSRGVIPSPEELARRAVYKAKLCLRRARIDSAKRMTVVFSSKAFASLLRATVLEALLGDNVVRGRSAFRDKLGEQVASEKLTLTDNGVLPGGDNTWRFDGEGVAMQETPLIEKGVLRGFVYDHYWGSRAGKASTGNAVRAGYASRPTPGYTNIVVSPGDGSEEELLEGSEVLYVEDVQGAHTSNPDTGEYSVLANPAILYKAGDPVGWVPGVMVSGNLFEEIASSIDILGETREHPFTGFYTPKARLKGIMVSPKQG